jgi:hypothetical protein
MMAWMVDPNDEPAWHQGAAQRFLRIEDDWNGAMDLDDTAQDMRMDGGELGFKFLDLA